MTLVVTHDDPGVQSQVILAVRSLIPDRICRPSHLVMDERRAGCLVLASSLIMMKWAVCWE